MTEWIRDGQGWCRVGSPKWGHAYIIGWGHNTRDASLSSTNYQSDVLHCYLMMIHEKTSLLPEAIVEIKGIKIEPPELYNGQDNLVIWERWLDSLFNYFYFYRVVGPQLDSRLVMLTGTWLSGIAAMWYTQEVTGLSCAP